MQASLDQKYNFEVVKWFTVASIIYLVVGTLVGVYIASELAWPFLNFNTAELSFGRLRPLHTNAVIFAFGGSSLMATSFYSVQRTCGVGLWSNKLAWFVFVGWNLIIVAAVITLPLGITSGKEYAELEWPIDIAIAVVWLSYSINFMMTVAKRKTTHIYVSNWFFMSMMVMITYLHVVNTGNGDMGNQCPHEIDIAQWVLGDKPLPQKIQAFGGRFGWNDAGDTPNMISAWYEVDGTPCIIEVNDMHVTPDRNAASMRDQIRVGIVVHCEGGQLRGGRGGMYAVGEDGKTKIEKFPGDAGGKHAENFVAAVRSRRREDIASKLEAAERSSALAHLANTSFRSGAIADGPTLEAAIGENEVLRQIAIDQAKQLDAWGVKSPKYRLGRSIDVDPAKARITTTGIDPTLSRREPRGEFTVPELA